MNLLLVRTFLNVVRYQSFSGAAEAMYISQPTVSMRLNQLEDELGVQLIKRRKGHRTVELTAKGQAFIPLAEHWLDLDHRTQQFCRQTVSEPIALGAPSSLQDHVMPGVVRKLQESGVSWIQMKTAASNEIYSSVSNHEVDVGLALRPLQKDGVVAIRAFTAETLLLCPADTPLPQEPILPDQLDPNYEIRVVSWTGEIRRWCSQYWDPSVIPYIQVDSNFLAPMYMDRPECWAVCPAWIVGSVMNRFPGKYSYRQLAIPAPRQTCYVVCLRTYQKSHPEVTETLLGCVREYASETPGLTPV